MCRRPFTWCKPMKITSTGLHFAILHHTGYGEPHYDLMFEVGPRHPLLTFRSAVWPIDRRVQLVRLGEHRRDYLSYEGPVSGDRGEVRKIAGGTFDLAGDGQNILLTYTAGTPQEPLVITDTAEAIPYTMFRLMSAKKEVPETSRHSPAPREGGS